MQSIMEIIKDFETPPKEIVEAYIEYAKRG